jgi:hypothetical protein
MDVFMRGTHRRLRTKDRSAVRLNLEPLEARQLLTCNIIDGHVYYDVNNNGLLDAGEQRLSAVPLELRDDRGVVVATTTTDGSGYYRFDRNFTVDTRTRTQEHSVSFSRSVNGAQTRTIPRFNDDLGTLTAVEVFFDGSITSTIRVENVNADEASQLVGRVSGNLTLTGPGVSGFQLNPNVIAGTFNATRFDNVIDYRGTSGVDFGSRTATSNGSRRLTDAITLGSYSGSGTVSFTLNSLVTSSVTGNGDEDISIRSTAAANVRVVYHYTPNDCLQPGSYTIHETQPAGYFDGKESRSGLVLPGSASSDVISVVLSGTDALNNDFGELRAASLSGCVYVDSNNNGLPDAGEPGIPGATVVLDGDTPQGSVHLTTTTGPDGSFSFLNLVPGVYTVSEAQPGGYEDGQDLAGSSGGLLRNDQVANFWLDGGENAVNYCFGERPLSRILSRSIRPLDFEPYPNAPIISKRQLSGDTPFINLVNVSASYINGLYRRFLNRDADQAGLVHWLLQLTNGAPRDVVVQGIWTSAEHRAIQVDELYVRILGRNADASGRAHWANRLMAGLTEEDVAVALLTSAEFRNQAPSNAEFVNALYAVVLNRTPDSAGHASHVQALAGGASPETVARGFVRSGEAYRLAVRDAYLAYLRRSGSPQELQPRVDQLLAGQTTLDATNIAVLASNECYNRALQVNGLPPI